MEQVLINEFYWYHRGSDNSQSMDDIKVGLSCDDQQLKLLLLTEKMYDKESAMSNGAGGVET